MPMVDPDWQAKYDPESMKTLDDEPAFYLRPAEGVALPLLVSCPHVGTEIPDGLKEFFRPEMLITPDDTDWCVHELYDFAPPMGISVIYARWSRYVIDLNRPPELGKSLYNDGRRETSVVSRRNFLGNPVYRDESYDPLIDLERRLMLYYRPYHAEVARRLNQLREEFGWAILYEAHSIARTVKTISPNHFPDLMLGDVDGSSSGASVSRIAREVLEKSGYSLGYNQTFKGGYLTRFFGKPSENIHAIQLERSLDIYWDSSTGSIDAQKKKKLQERALKPLFEALLKQKPG